jgi:salicylate hydroxylase
VDDTHLGIVGAGVAGLTAALALRHQGFRNVTVFERNAGETSEPSHALEITANASRVLHALGLERELKAAAEVPPFCYLRTRRTGFLLIQRPLGNFAESRYGAPTYVIDRAALETLLARACLARGIEIRRGVNVVGADPETGRVTLDHGQTADFHAVVIATGSGAPLAETVRGHVAEPPKRFQVLSAVCDAPPPLESIVIWVDPDFYCVQYPTSANRTDLLVVSSEPRVQGHPEARLGHLLAGSHHQLAGMLDQIRSVDAYDGTGAAVADYWYAGRLVLLGDACHTLPVWLPLGAGAAIEDAWVLSVMMERWEEAPEEGYPDYQRYRRRRLARLVAGADREAADLLLADPRALLLRNVKWGLANRFLPEMSIARLDWLYAYDCIRGFA